MLLSLSIAEAFKSLILQMSASIFILIAIGIMLIIMEFYQPTNKLLGFLGIAFVVAGLVVRFLSGSSFMVLYLHVFFVALALFASHIAILFLQKGGWMARAQSLQSAKNVGGKGYAYLKNMTGIAVSDIDNSGNISINEVNFKVISKQKIEKGNFVRVIKVDGEDIFVELFNPEEEM